MSRLLLITRVTVQPYVNRFRRGPRCHWDKRSNFTSKGAILFYYLASGLESRYYRLPSIGFVSKSNPRSRPQSKL